MAPVGALRVLCVLCVLVAIITAAHGAKKPFDPSRTRWVSVQDPGGRRFQISGAQLRALCAGGC